MRFDEERQGRFDILIGQAALAGQERRFSEAFEHLQKAEALLTEHGITDAYDWSGYLDLRMSIQENSKDHQAAATTARQMLDAIDPMPEGFSPRQQEIIQDSLVEAALLRARHLLTLPTQEAAAELGPLIDSAMHWCERLGRDGDEREFREMRESLAAHESGTA